MQNIAFSWRFSITYPHLGTLSLGRCDLTPDSGNAGGQENRWYYDSTTGECQNFFYTGAGGNANRFDSRALCEAACAGGE